ncbi:MAG: metal ABC transporter ATP-binding protein [Candidatus Moranbacteria bacterium]|nr:metal ABC transporter ATP-binding protein [Candidatus Moranbacteria bacterium]
MHNNNCIEFANINFSYPHNQVLDDISFTVQEGDYVGLVGGNGSGKTTILRIMLGLIPFASGSAKLFGEDVEDFDAWHLIGYVPQHVARGEASFGTTVREVIESGLVSRKKYFLHKQPADEKLIQWAMNVAEIADLEHRMIGMLSGGERQLVFIARALVSRPKLLVLDEPTTGVDAQSQERFYRLLSALNQSHGMTIMLVSHDLEVVAREVKTVICVNRKLVCHVNSREFIEGDYLKRLYGEDMKYIHHEHNH